MGLRGLKVAVWALFALLLSAATARAQVMIDLIDTDPPGVTITNLGQFTLTYSVMGDQGGGVEVNFFRDDGDQTVVAIPDTANPPPPFMVTLPLRTNVDRDPNMFTAVVRDLVDNTIDLAGPFTILADDVGPEMPTVTSPVFPATVFQPTVNIAGTVLNQGPGIPMLPETEGTIVVRLPGPPPVTIGGGAITSNSDFVAIADLSGLILGTPTDIEIVAIDAAGNEGTTLTVQITRLQAAAPSVVASVDPPDGTITRDPGVVITGAATGDVPPLTVNIFVDGLLESQITGLASGQDFIHTVNLPGEGPHTISIQATNSNVPPDVGLATVLGTITLDRTPPSAPLILTPPQTGGPLVTNAGTFMIEGISTERDTVTTDAFMPQVFVQGPPGVVLNPPSPLSVNNSTGQFGTTVDIAALADGDYLFDVTVRDEAGNLGPESTARVAITVDRTPPFPERILVDGIAAPQADPEIFVGQVSVPIQVTFSELLDSPPDLFVTQDQGMRIAAGRQGVSTRTVDWAYGVIPGQDGPVMVEITGGSDRAGNAINQTFTRLFVVDTVPPNIVSIDPADLTTVGMSPERIRVRLEDPPSAAGTFSGVDLLNTTIEVIGPLGSNSAMIPGTATPFDPFTLDFVPATPLTVDGFYRVRVVAQDEVGNRALTFTSTFILDTTPIRLSAANVLTNPPDGACVNENTHPGGAAMPFVDVTIDDEQFDVDASTLVVRDFCRVPPEIPGQKQVVDADTMRYVFDAPLPVDGSRDGIFAIQMDVLDIAGNASPTFTTTYVYDTSEPSVEATFPVSGSAVNGPLRIVDATLMDPRPDFCRAQGGISRTTSTIALTLVEPNPNSNTQMPETPVMGTLRFEAVGEVERILLELVDTSGFPRGLRTDGGDDGLYRVEAQAFDCAGNMSPLSTNTFTYDTRLPNLVIDDLVDGATLSGDEFTITGTLQDDLGGSGVEEVVVTLEAVDSRGIRTTDPFFLDAPAELDPVAVDAVDPVVDWTFVGDLRRVPSGTRARLRVRGFDRAGNFAERLFSVTAMNDLLRPPVQSAPASGAATNAKLLTFSWEAVQGAAAYRLRLVSPNNDVVEFDTPDATPSLTVNLTGLPDPEGRYTWSVAGIDGAGGLGRFSPNRGLIVDRDLPEVIAIDVVDPSPEAVGSINEGLVRLTLHFDDVMDTTRPPLVRVQPQNTNIPPLVVTQLSYADDLWQGEFTIPEAGLGVPDHNGIAEVLVTRAFDRAGNEVVPPLGGITLFEIDTGPFFRIGVFKNPVDEQDAILLVKGFTRDGGVAEDVPEPPAVLVRRAGQALQTPVLHRVNGSVFRGLFRLEADSTADVRVEVTGRDRQGNTASREIELAVTRLSPREAIRIQAQGLTMDLPAGSVKVATTLTALRAGDALQPQLSEGGELELVRALGQVGPVGQVLTQAAALTLDGGAAPPPADADADDGAASGAVGLFRRDEAGMVFLGTWGEDGALTASTRRLGPMFLLRDGTPPSVGEPTATWRGATLHLEVPAADRGAGLGAGRSVFRVGNAEVPARFDAEAGALVAELDASRVRPGEAVEAQAEDGLGNRAVSAAAVVPAPAYGVSEAVFYPNPARRRATLRYRLNQAVSRVRLDIYDTAGRRIRRLAGTTGAGLNELRWNLETARGRPVKNGVYLAVLRVEGAGGAFHERLKIAVLR